jgi:hypothetical protein
VATHPTHAGSLWRVVINHVIFFAEDCEEREKVRKAGKCCRDILSHVNQAVKEAEDKQVNTLVANDERE